MKRRRASENVRGPLLLVVLLACAVAAGCAKKTSMTARGQGGPPGAGAGGFKPPPMPVEVAAVTQGQVADQFRGVGTIEAGEAITVVAEIDALVESLPFREGQPVAKGGLIARLDDAQLRAELARAEAMRDQSQINYDRIKALVEKGAAAQQDLDNASAALKVGEANAAVARTRLSKTRITAPFAGILGSRNVSPGAYIRAGQAITDLAAIDEIKVTFSAPERYLGKLVPGAPVTVSAPAFPGYELTGRIDVVEPVLDPNTRSTKIIARVRNPDRRFRPGMSADVSVVMGERPQALTIPSEAVFAEGDQAYVYVVKPDSTVTRTAVELGARQSDVVEVVKGLDPGMRVVRAGHQKLFDGARVMPVTSRPDSSRAQVP